MCDDFILAFLFGGIVLCVYGVCVGVQANRARRLHEQYWDTRHREIAERFHAGAEAMRRIIDNV